MKQINAGLLNIGYVEDGPSGMIYLEQTNCSIL